MKLLINTRTNWKHCVLENSIRKLDPSPEMSRSAIFARAVNCAKGVENWETIQQGLADLKYDPEVPLSFNFQARVDDQLDGQLEGSLKEVRRDIEAELKEKGIITRLQTQYLLQLLLLNYLRVLEKERIDSRKSRIVEESTLTLPEMAKIFTEIILIDPKCDELMQIRTILANWRNTHPEMNDGVPEVK